MPLFCSRGHERADTLSGLDECAAGLDLRSGLGDRKSAQYKVEAR